MSSNLKTTLIVLMSMALSFGFFPLFIRDNFPYQFERLHVFLFNLCSGGTILIHYTEGQRLLSRKALLFLWTSVFFAVCAFFEIYVPAMILAVLLAAIVEWIRVRRFSPVPFDFFRPDVPIAEKFHQASLLCLSMGLIISCLVIANNEYVQLISFPKLKLDTFFLGFSFPLSLITMSVMFSLIRENYDSTTHILKDLAFWTVNLGVIIFLLFILFEKMVSQLIIASILAGAVILIFYLFRRYTHPLQQRNFLTSGMVFLLCTAVTGILYIVLEFYPDYYHYRDNARFLLRLHTFVSLYGWNLSGLTVISRYDDFPIRLHSRILIAFHWILVVLLAPMGNYYRPIAILTTICYIVLLYFLFFSRKSNSISQPY